ncbi:MAG: cobalamin biosynthesis protein CbiX [Rubrivivax sp.]|nr:MAG: cobalamin biosynthesis protein CbiX [Rubrivivax sp.]
MAHGILLLAHGARDPAWARPFEQTLDQLAARGRPVALSFLEFISPDLVEAGRQLVDQGCTAVTVVPLFLGAGGHVRKDVPVLMERLRQTHPAVDWQLARAVGETATVVDALAQAAWALADGAPGAAPAPDRDTP